MRLAGLGAMAAVCCTAGVAWGQEAPAPRVYFPSPRVMVSAQLTYEREPGAEICPDEARFRLEMMGHMGWDSFLADPEAVPVGKVHVVVGRLRDGFSARYEWTGSPGCAAPERSLPGVGYGPPCLPRGRLPRRRQSGGA